VLCLKRVAGGRIFDGYERILECVWDTAIVR
jgi:hypothetical protein